MTFVLVQEANIKSAVALIASVTLFIKCKSQPEEGYEYTDYSRDVLAWPFHRIVRWHFTYSIIVECDLCRKISVT